MCAVKFFLGIPCPGCGLMHALWALVHGDVTGAFLFFPVWPLLLLLPFSRRYLWAGHMFVIVIAAQWFWRIGTLWGSHFY